MIWVEYLDERMQDGSRLFAVFKFDPGWRVLHRHLQTMEGLVVTGFLTDGVTEGWLDFNYFGKSFTIHDPLGEFHVFSQDGDCSPFILGELMKHFRKLQPSA